MSAEQTRIIPSLNLPAVGCCCPSLLPRHTAGSYLACCLPGLPHPFQQNCPQSVSSQPVLLHGVIPFQMQEFAVAHAEFHKAPVSHFLPSFLLESLNSSPALKTTYWFPPFDSISKPDQSASLCCLLQVTD